jgi:TolA-binding protein
VKARVVSALPRINHTGGPDAMHAVTQASEVRAAEADDLHDQLEQTRGELEVWRCESEKAQVQLREAQEEVGTGGTRLGGLSHDTQDPCTAAMPCRWRPSRRRWPSSATWRSPS